MRVLLADDSVVNRRVVRAILQAQGISVVEAAGAEEALRLAREERVDAVFSDVMMPGMNGFTLHRALRREPETRALPFVAYTGNQWPFVLPDEVRGQADAFFELPATAEKVRAALRQIRLAP